MDTTSSSLKKKLSFHWKEDGDRIASKKHFLANRRLEYDSYPLLIIKELNLLKIMLGE